MFGLLKGSVVLMKSIDWMNKYVRYQCYIILTGAYVVDIYSIKRLTLYKATVFFSM